MSICFHDGGGDDRGPMRGSEATERGEGVGGGIPLLPRYGLFPKLEYQNAHFRALRKRFSRELNVVKFHGEELMSYSLNID